MWVCCGLAALPALAGENFGGLRGLEVRFLEPASGSRFAPGDDVLIRWTGAPPASEVELLLSVDGGRSFPVRLTHELEGNATSYRWRVPRLPAAGARLALRGKIEGEEVEVGWSAPFSIETPPKSSSLSTREGEGAIRTVRGELWWVDRAIAGSEGEPPPLSGLESSPEEPAYHPARGESILADPAVPDGLGRPAAASRGHEPPRLAATPSEANPRPLARVPRPRPLRI